MRVLVCGGRDYGEPRGSVDGAGRPFPPEIRARAESQRAHVQSVLAAFHSAQPIARLIEGGARGADGLAKAWAREMGIPVETFAPEWSKYGKTAGPIRNQGMLHDGKPDVVIAFPGGAGTAHMVKIARAAGVEVLIVKETE